MKKKKLVLNITISIISQIITLALGLLLPRIILTVWGSEYNGLLNSVTTIMRYLTILEAGISASTLQSLYKYVSTNDRNKISIVVKSSQNYYHKISVIYFLLILAISFVYPLFLSTSINYWEIVLIIALQGATGIINFSFFAAYQQLLNAEGKYYIISIISLFTTVFTYIGKIISVIFLKNIFIMQLVGLVVMAIQIIVYYIYFKYKYKWIDKNAKVDMCLLENRKYYIIQQICGLIFNSTDTLVLSISSGLKVASVYTVYNLVYSALSMIIAMLRNSMNFLIGQAFHKNLESFHNVYRLYSSFQVSLGCILSSTSLLLINGFIGLYTEGVNDINYINYVAAILFSLNIILDCTRGACLAGANIANCANETKSKYIIEAFLNLAISLLLVNRFGICGVLLGTVISGIWRSIDSILYFNKRVLKMMPYKEFCYILINITVYFIFVFIGNRIQINITNYSSFFIAGAFCTIPTTLIFSTIYFVFNYSLLKRYIKFKRK